MKLVGVVSIGSYTQADLERKKQSLQTVLRPVHVSTWSQRTVVYRTSSQVWEFYVSEVAVARKVLEVAQMGYDAVVGTAFLDNGLDRRVDWSISQWWGQPKQRSTWQPPWPTNSP